MPRRPRGTHPKPVAEPAATVFARIYEAHVDFVFGALRRLGVCRALLEDAAHDVFVVLWRKWSDYDRTRPIRPWLFGIAYRVASDVRRRACEVHEVSGEPADEHDPRPDPEASVLTAETRAQVRGCLDAIAVERRAVFIMHELDDVAIPQVALALEIPLNTAYSRLRLARAEFERAAHARLRHLEGAVTSP